MSNIYLARVTHGPMAGTLQTITLEEWVTIVRKNKQLPLEARRYFIIDCIIENDGVDRMYIEVDRDTYNEWHRENQAMYRNRIAKKQFLHISMDAEIENGDGDILQDFLPSDFSLETHTELIIALEELYATLKDWKPWALDLLKAHINGDSRACTRKLAQKYGVTERQMRNYKRQFSQKIKSYEKTFPF